MFSKLVALCAFVAVAQAGILAAPAQYSPAEAVSSQSIVRHDQAQLQAAPLAKLAVAAPIYQTAPVAYQAAPARYSSAAAVSSQNIVRHDQPAYQPALAPIVYKSAPAPIVYKAAPAPVVYKSAPAPIVYKSAPAPIVYKAAPAPIVYKSAPAPIVYKSAPAPIIYKAAPAPIVYKAAPAPIVYKSAPVTKVIAQQEEIAYPKYEYSYSVADGHTGDNKSQQESRDGDVVRGSYSFQEADGSIRTVEYTADDHNGFNAVVQNSAPKAAVVKAAPLLVKAAPAIQYYQH